jgi:hypothetical protein
LEERSEVNRSWQPRRLGRIATAHSTAGSREKPTEAIATREAACSETNSEGRWRCFTYDELAKRHRLNRDVSWIKDTSLEDAGSPPEPDILAQEIAADLQAAMELFATIANELRE